MFDQVLDNISVKNNPQIKDSNKEMGERVRRYTLINRYFDNYLRFNKKQLVVDYVKYLLLFSALITYILNKIFLDLSPKENFNLVLSEFGKLFSYIAQYVFNSLSSKLELLFDLIDLPIKNHFSIEKIVYEPKLELDLVFTGVSIILVIYFLLVIYQYLIQRDLFNSTFTNYYVPLWSVFFYTKRNKTNYFYVRLIRHQKQVNVISTYSKNILKNLFNLEDLVLDKKDKIDIELSPRKFLWFYDYYLITYSINHERVDSKTTQEEGETKTSTTSDEQELDLDLLKKLNI